MLARSGPLTLGSGLLAARPQRPAANIPPRAHPGRRNAADLCYTTGMYDQHLAQAERHVAQFQARVARQKQIVDELTQAGHNTDCALSMLRALKKCLSAFEEHLALISGQQTVG